MVTNTRLSCEGEKGFIFIAVVAAVALALVAGGTYYMYNKQDASDENIKYPSDMTNEERDAQVGVQANNNGSSSIRTLLSLGKNVRCDVKTDESNGVAFVAGNRVRADFEVTASASTADDAHMIADGEHVYVWSGSQGMKMVAADANSSTSAQTQGNTQAGLDTQIEYTCTDWVVDEEKFTPPTTVNFTDISAMIRGNVNSGVNVNTSVTGTVTGGDR
ncbi:MAG TPA: hypothetical protein PLF31_02600 [Candidatus Paceibacterota bacterium]|nr:hypothetical protein [Candidatus Paceibacterota bacterium]